MVAYNKSYPYPLPLGIEAPVAEPQRLAASYIVVVVVQMSGGKPAGNYYLSRKPAGEQL